MVHRGEVFEGDHEAIVDRAMFEAVQEKLKSGTVERKLKLKSSPSLLMGKIYDDQGNRMTPSHTVKNGLRYRYYVSKRAPNAQGPALRVPAPEIEALVADAIRSHVAPEGDGSDSPPLAEIDRLVVGPEAVTIQLMPGPEHEEPPLTMPWNSLRGVVVLGPAADSGETNAVNARNRDAVLTAIAKARLWVEELTGNQATIPEIAEREGKGERYIRLLLPLAFTGASSR